MDLAPHDLKVSQSTRLDLHGDPYQVYTYTYFLGAHGPFSFELPCHCATPEAVQAKINEQAMQLQQIGAATARGY